MAAASREREPQCRCGRGAGCAQSRCSCGRGEPSPGADVAGVSPVPTSHVLRTSVLGLGQRERLGARNQAKGRMNRGCVRGHRLGTREHHDLSSITTSCNAVQHLATQYTILQRSTPSCNAVHHLATQYNILQRSTTSCNAVQHLATQYNILQRCVREASLMGTREHHDLARCSHAFMDQ